ncbi:hypothetical protein [Pseudaminobacter sp. NGMCC 1.201702]|uniref:hypothetical protein n=1 Tax=Pseudaminobacter sp. NGMCC 1.201702 TaxID=3391825 RepID=UPI0039EFC044
MKVIGPVSALTLALTGSSIAADMNNPVVPENQPVAAQGWTVTAAPYFWMAGISGNVAQFGSPTVSIDRSFSDIFDDLKFGGMVLGEARNGPFSIVGDLIYTKMASDRGTSRGIVASKVAVSSETFTGFLGAGYAVVDSDPLRLDVIGGARLWSVDTDIAISGGILDDQTFHDGATWVDAMAGLRLNYSLTPKLFLTGWSFVGAGAADVDWDVAGAVGYHISDRFSALVGYRALGVDYEKGSFVFDIVQQGPILGLTMQF